MKHYFNLESIIDGEAPIAAIVAPLVPAGGLLRFGAEDSAPYGFRTVRPDGFSPRSLPGGSSPRSPV